MRAAPVARSMRCEGTLSSHDRLPCLPAFHRLEADDRLLKEAFAASDDGEATLPFLAGSLSSFKERPALVEALGDNIKPGDKHFVHVSDLDRASRCQVGFKGVKRL